MVDMRQIMIKQKDITFYKHTYTLSGILPDWGRALQVIVKK